MAGSWHNPSPTTQNYQSACKTAFDMLVDYNRYGDDLDPDWWAELHVALEQAGFDVDAAIAPIVKEKEQRRPE